MASIRTVIFTIALLASGFGGTAAQSGLGLLLSTPALAPAISYLFNDPALLSTFATGNLFPALAGDAPAIAQLVQSPSVLDVLNNKATLTEVVTSPILSRFNNAPLPQIPGEIDAFLAASKVPSTGDPQTDLNNITAALGFSVPAPAPSSSSNRRMLRGTQF